MQVVNLGIGANLVELNITTQGDMVLIERRNCGNAETVTILGLMELP